MTFLLVFRCSSLLLLRSTPWGHGRLPERCLVKDTGKKWHETGTASSGGSGKRSRPSVTASPSPTEPRCRHTWMVPWNKQSCVHWMFYFLFWMRTCDWLQCNSDFDLGQWENFDVRPTLMFIVKFEQPCTSTGFYTLCDCCTDWHFSHINLSINVWNVVFVCLIHRPSNVTYLCPTELCHFLQVVLIKCVLICVNKPQ